jgi:xanthine dehydrogenase accessory factor
VVPAGATSLDCVFDIAVTVNACLRARTRVDVAWPVDVSGFGPVDHNEALAITPGGGRVGSLISGALDSQLVDRSAAGLTGRLLDLEVSELDALVAGVSGTGRARCLVVAAEDLPADLWDRLVERVPVCLVARLEDDLVTGYDLYDAETVAQAGEEVVSLFKGRVSATRVDPGSVTTVLWPVPKLLTVGGGPIAAALGRAAELLGWQVRSFTESGDAPAHIVGLSGIDSVVVFGHDDGLTGPALRAALSSPVGYIGSVGPRPVQESRVDWLVRRGVEDRARIHGPAGLDIGASAPAEIAVSILAQSLAVRAGRTVFVSDR